MTKPTNLKTFKKKKLKEIAPLHNLKIVFSGRLVNETMTDAEFVNVTSVLPIAKTMNKKFLEK